MSTSPYELVLFSARREGARALPFAPSRVLDELRPIGDSADAGAILIVDLGSGADVDAGRLRQVEAFAEAQGQGAARRFAAVALVGDVGGLSSPEHVVWLKPDGVWPAWPTAEFAERALASICAIRRDAIKRDFAERVSRALSIVGASDARLSRTVEVVCEAAAALFGTHACALLLRDVQHARVFPIHVWLSTMRWSGGKSPEGLIFDERDLPWPTDARQRLHVCRAEGLVGGMISEMLANDGKGADMLVILSLPLDREGSAADCGYLALPLTRRSFAQGNGVDTDIEDFLRLCTRQLESAATRDAFDLVPEVLSNVLRTHSSAGHLEELDEALDEARRALQAHLPMDGCSIFRTGVEERLFTLQLATTSGMGETAEKTTYIIGDDDAPTAKVAHDRRPRITFEMAKDISPSDRQVEKTSLPGRTWMGVPLLDHRRRSVGVIRCVNRLVAADRPVPTGFSFLDLRIVGIFARACAVLTERALMQEQTRRMLSRITHELRTPAVGIQNNVRYLQRTIPEVDSKLGAKLSDLELDASVLLNLLQQVDLLRGGAISPQREPRMLTNVVNIVRKTYFQLVPELRARGFDPERVDIDLYSLPMLWLPRAAFVQIIFNLFMNSIKYAHSDPNQFRIAVHIERTVGDHSYRVHFKDHGIGVENADKYKIFEDGFRAPAARLHDARGLGLGLTISRKLIQQMGGDLTIGSLSGPTDFVLTLPKELAQKPKGAP